MFSKPLNELTREDIVRVIDEKVQESAEVEFKETLPAENGRDSWMDSAGSIGRYARNKLLEEVIALANTYGGTLIIGVSETSEKPSRADEIVPLPRCVDLAEILRMQCRDCIDPQVPHLDAHGVVTQDDGSGVVVIRVPASRMAPHRHTKTKECYIRRSDRSEPMNMREIRDLTLQVERGLAGIEKKFNDRREAFAGQINSFFFSTESGFTKEGFGARATLIPLTDLYLQRVHNVDDVRPNLRRFDATYGNSSRFDLNVPCPLGRWRPIIRGTRGEGDDVDLYMRSELHCDGLIEYILLSIQKSDQRPHMFPSWIMALVASALCSAERFRREAGAPDTEFCLEFEICVRGPDLPVADYGRHAFNPFGEHFPKDPTPFPRYSVGAVEEFPRVMADLEMDFWHAVGRDREERLEVDFAAVLD